MARRPLSSFVSGTQHTAGWLILTVAVAIAYFLAARLGLALLTKPDGVAVFWPAAGVSAGLLIALGPRARWAVVIGAMVATIGANLLGDRSFGSALVFAVCNAGEALIIATLIERYFGSPFSLDRLSHVIGFLGAAVAGTTISGIGGTLGFLMHTSTAPILITWYHWVTSDGLGVITVAPLLIGLRASLRDPPSHRETFEGAVALGTLVILSMVLIFLPRERWATILAIAALFPLLLWLGARCRPVFSSAAAFIVSLTIVCTTTFGIGVFGDANFPVAERILSAQAGILAVALCSYVLAALFEERRRHEAMLTESEARLQEALTAGGVAAFDWEVQSDNSRRSDNAALILGFDPKQNFGGAEFFARVHPSDQPQLLGQLRDLQPERPILDSTFRFIRQDGREIWLEQTAKAEFDAAGELSHMRGLTLDITDRKHAEQRQDLLIAELDHRVKNVLARVAVVIRQTLRGQQLHGPFRRIVGRPHPVHGRGPFAAQPNALARRRHQRSGARPARALCVASQCQDRRAEHRSQRERDPGIGHGAARTGDQRGKIRGVVGQRRRFGDVAKPGCQQRRNDPYGRLAGIRRAAGEGAAAVRIWH